MKKPLFKPSRKNILILLLILHAVYLLIISTVVLSIGLEKVLTLIRLAPYWAIGLILFFELITTGELIKFFLEHGNVADERERVIRLRVRSTTLGAVKLSFIAALYILPTMGDKISAWSLLFMFCIPVWLTEVVSNILYRRS